MARNVPRITLRTLAAELGLTEAAVSMALRNHPRIAPATRARAKALAKERGYVPNPALARQGSLGKPRAFEGMPMALLLQINPTHGPGRSLYEIDTAEVARGFGYKLQTHSMPTGQTAAIARMLYARGVEAVLLGPLFDPAFNDDFPWELFSVVALEGGHFRPPCHIVMPDLSAAMAGAARQAIGRGYRRIGLVEFVEPVEPVDHLDRVGGAAICAAMVGAAGGEFSKCVSPGYDARPFLRWHRRFRPDAIIAQTGTPYWWLREHLPEHAANTGIAVLRLNAYEIADGLSGFVEDHRLTAAVAVKLLDAEVRNFDRGRPPVPTRQLVEMPWSEGRTLPDRTDATRPSKRPRKRNPPAAD